MKRRSLIVYIPAHFIVDFTCAVLLYSSLYKSGKFYQLLLLYNFCAFALQMPIGLFADRLNKNALCAAAGCCLIALSFGFTTNVLVAAVIAGIGNSLFHIGGGIDVLNSSDKKPSLLGMFVAPGALGIYLGTIWSRQMNSIYLPLIAIILTAIIIPVVTYADKRSFHSDNNSLSLPDKCSFPLIISVCCLLAVVSLRSYVGLSVYFPWNISGNWSAILIASVVCGKLAGGFLIELLGGLKAAFISLGLAAVLFIFSNTPIVGIIAVCLFNMTMPVTLWTMAKLLQGSKGFSFGILTFGLFIGFIPVYLDLPRLASNVSGYTAIAVISLLLLLPGLRKVESV